MPSGQRDGKVTKDVLRERLSSFATPQDFLPTAATSSVTTLLGHAIFYNVVDELEIEETAPRTEKTIPCYLQPRIRHMPKGTPEAIEKYVLAASTLAHRQGIIGNLLAQRLYGRRSPPVDNVARRFALASESQQSARLWAFVDPPDVRNSPFKQLFLPERWPTADVVPDADVATILLEYADVGCDRAQRAKRMASDGIETCRQPGTCCG